MIVGITGAICSGKHAFAQYLVQTHGFEAISVMEIFKIRLRKQRKDALKKIEAQRQKAAKKKLEKAKTEPAAQIEKCTQEESKEESKEEEENETSQVSDRDLGIEEGDNTFCYAYYQAEYKSLRQAIIKEVFRDLTGKWGRNFVVYPLSPCDDIQLML